MTTPEELDALQQRLLSRDKSRHGYSGHPLYNRDGPEASGAITALRARVAELDAATDQLQYIASANATRAEKAEAGGPLIEYIRADLATPAPVVPAEGLDPERLVMAWMSEMEGFATRGERFMDTITDGNDVAPWLHAACQVGIDAALRSAPPVGARVTDDAAAFDRADWFWRTMDPDDCGDSPEEAISRAMVGQFCVCEIASSYHGPTRYGFIAPVLDPESDDEEFVHFATQQEAVEAAKARLAALLPAGEGE